MCNFFFYHRKSFLLLSVVKIFFLNFRYKSVFHALYKSEINAMNTGACETHDFQYLLIKKSNFFGIEVHGKLFPRTSRPSTKNRFCRFSFFRGGHIAPCLLDLTVLTCPDRGCSLHSLFHKWERNSCLSCHDYWETQRLLFCHFFFVVCQLSILSCYSL